MEEALGGDERHQGDWGPWALLPEDGRPFREPLADPDRVYRPRLFAPGHSRLAREPGYLAVEWAYFDLDDFIDAAKVVRQLMGLASYTEDLRALSGFFYAVIDCLDWWDLPAEGTLGGWYGQGLTEDPVVRARARGWGNVHPPEYDWVEPEDTYPPRLVWGPWWLDDLAMALRTNDHHEVRLLQCRTAEAIMHKLIGLAHELDAPTLAGLIRAIGDVLRPGSWRRPFGADKGIELNDVAVRVQRTARWRGNARYKPTCVDAVLQPHTMSVYQAADAIGAWEPTVVRAVETGAIPSYRLHDSVVVRMDEVRGWAELPENDIGPPADFVSWQTERRQEREGEEAFQCAVFEFVNTNNPWTGSQAELFDNVTPTPTPPGWPTPRRVIHLLRYAYHPSVGRRRQRPMFQIDEVGKIGNRVQYRVAALPSKSVVKSARSKG